MLPRAQAAINFVRWSGRPAAIGQLADLPEILAGRRGTLVSPDGGRISFHDREGLFEPRRGFKLCNVIVYHHPH